MRRIPEMAYQVGQHVYRTGQNAVIVADRGDGSYDVELSSGEVVREWPSNLAPRAN